MTTTKKKTKNTKKSTAAQENKFALRKAIREKTSSVEFEGLTKRTKDNMPDFYQVKYWEKSNPKNVRYGIHNAYASDSEKYWKNGELLIEDAITGKRWRLPIDRVVVENIPSKWMSRDEEDEYDSFMDEEWKKACKKSDNSKTLKDKLFSVGVADGNAWYIITKETKTTVHVEWRGFGSGDRWVDQMLGYGGKYPKGMIEPLVVMREKLSKMFDQ